MRFDLNIVAAGMWDWELVCASEQDVMDHSGRLNAICTLHSIPFCIRHSQAKCMLVMAICVCVCLSHAAFIRYCTHLGVTLKNGRGCCLAVHCWAVL